MNNLFNLNRFGRLFIKHTVEHYKSYLMSLFVLIGVMVLGGTFLVFMMPGTMDIGVQLVLFMILLLLSGTIFTSTVFSDIGDKKKAVAALTLPASHLEKYLVAWLYSFVIFLLVFTGCFYLVMEFLISLKHVPGQVPEVFNVFHNNFGTQIFLIFALLHAISFFGSIFFDKLQFIKTAFAFFISVGLLIVINNIFQSALVKRQVSPNPPFGSLRFLEKGKYVAIDLGGTQGDHVLYIAVAVAFIFWIAAYYRLKEKQV